MSVDCNILYQLVGIVPSLLNDAVDELVADFELESESIFIVVIVIII